MVHEHKTPFLQNDLRSLAVNNAAFRVACEMIPERPSGVYEPFAGIGSQSRVIQAVWPGVRHIGVERDEATFEKLAEVRDEVNMSNVYNVDAKTIVPENYSLGSNALQVLDSNWTLLPSNVAENLPWFWRGARWFIQTDLSRGYLHRNWERYGLKDRQWDTYLAKMAEVTGLEVVGYSPTKRSLGYVVLKRT